MFACLALVLSACSGGSEIVGEWKLTNFDIGIEIAEEQREMFDAMEKEMIENSTLTFGSDGSYEQYNKDENGPVTVTGTYKLEGEKLTIWSDGGVDEMNCEITDKGELITSYEDEGSVYKMTYKRK